jgi:hypothetical protein
MTKYRSRAVAISPLQDRDSTYHIFSTQDKCVFTCHICFVSL